VCTHHLEALLKLPLAIHEALERLAEKSPRKAELVKLRYFLGCTIPESADVLGIAAATAEEDWTYAKAWLRRDLAREELKNEGLP
jgi:DNA-directed RNA polymerase specialized sigma24 family protein